MSLNKEINLDGNLTFEDIEKIARLSNLDSFTREVGQRAIELIGSHHRIGVQLIPYGSNYYPKSLAAMSNPPKILFARGNRELLRNESSVAIVGSRSASQYGLKVTERVATHFTKKNYSIVSGLAAGIDSAAHSNCLAHKGRTIAVLAHGLHRIYPSENTVLANSILDNEGLLISEHPLGVEPQKHFFVLRNRIQVGLSRMSIIIEASRKSGTMSHAEYCLQARHPLYVVIPPESKCKELASHFEGNIFLLQEKGAIPLRSYLDYPTGEKNVREPS